MEASDQRAVLWSVRHVMQTHRFKFLYVASFVVIARGPTRFQILSMVCLNFKS